MTICMGAMGTDEDGVPVVVIASDRQVTLGSLIEFEHQVPKMTPVTDSAAVLVAGDALAGNELFERVHSQDGMTSRNVSEVARSFAGAYADHRLERIKKEILGIRRLTLDAYYANQHSLQPQLVMVVDQGMQQFDPNLEFLIAGVDASGGHLYSVSNPGGRPISHAVIGYTAIGSGALHALQAMIAFEHGPSCSLAEALFRVYAAKRRAQVAPGVGPETDMAVIREKDIRLVTKEDLQTLDRAYTKYTGSVEAGITGLMADIDLKGVAGVVVRTH